MAFIDKILQPPSYGWDDGKGNLVTPTAKTLFAEAFKNVNIFKSKKNWISFFSWSVILALLPFFYFFVTEFFTVGRLLLLVGYGMMVTSVHGTIWFHRYCTHKSFTFKHPIWRIITQNLVVKTVIEEAYVISHHVHHAKSDLPGDPYNAKAGLLYCMLADVNHQNIAKNFDEPDYNRVTSYLKHTGIKLNSYSKYLKWGTVTSPFYALTTHLLNWVFWYGIFFLIGGHGLACALFSASMFWFVLVRAFNYTGHGHGKVKHKDGVDFDRNNLSINQLRPGLLSGEWHNNHHLFPKSARSGFLPYQLDLAWVYIYCLSKLGLVTSFIDSKKQFNKYRKKYMEDHKT